jgi:hypothetical protein
LNDVPFGILICREIVVPSLWTTHKSRGVRVALKREDHIWRHLLSSEYGLDRFLNTAALHRSEVSSIERSRINIRQQKDFAGDKTPLSDSQLRQQPSSQIFIKRLAVWNQHLVDYDALIRD